MAVWFSLFFFKKGGGLLAHTFIPISRLIRNVKIADATTSSNQVCTWLRIETSYPIPIQSNRKEHWSKIILMMMMMMILPASS